MQAILTKSAVTSGSIHIFYEDVSCVNGCPNMLLYLTESPSLQDNKRIIFYSYFADA